MIVKRFVKLVVLAMMSLVVACGDGGDSEEKGIDYNKFISNNVWQLDSEESLFALASYVNNVDNEINVDMTKDILLNQNWNQPIGIKFKPYIGEFNGNNYTISNLIITGSNNGVGLFGYVGDGRSTPKINNLNIYSADVSGYEYVGVLSANIENAIIDKINIRDFKLYARKYAGAITGYSNDSNITNTHVEQGYVTGKRIYVDECGAVPYYMGVISGAFYNNVLQYDTIINTYAQISFSSDPVKPEDGSLNIACQLNGDDVRVSAYGGAVGNLSH